MAARVTANAERYTYTFGSGETVDEKGRVIGRSLGRESGLSGATLKFVTYPKGLFKFIATGASVGQLWSDSARLAAASNGFNAAGSLCGALPDAIAEGASAVSSLTGKKREYVKGAASSFKSLAGFSGLAGALHKMKVVTVSASGLYAFGVVKNIADVIGDLFTIVSEWFIRKSSADKMPDQIVGVELKNAVKGELWAARVKSIAAIVFHIFLAIGAIFLIPISPIAVTVLAVTYTVTVIAHHYIKSHKEDLDIRHRVRYVNLAVS